MLYDISHDRYQGSAKDRTKGIRGTENLKKAKSLEISKKRQKSMYGEMPTLRSSCYQPLAGYMKASRAKSSDFASALLNDLRFREGKKQK